MGITTVMFDLDGTLLPMDNDEFTRGYFKMLAAKLAPRGYEAGALVDNIWAGVAAMVKNDGTRLNREAFWDCFGRAYGGRSVEDRPLIEEFYAVDFKAARRFAGYNPAAAETVALVKSLSLRAVLATNPLFPAIATETRIAWAGLSADSFELVTTYDNTSWCKPNPGYYLDILSRLGLDAGDCLMVGNDVDEDILAAAGAGIRGFLLTDCLINRAGRDISAIPHGGFGELREYIIKAAQ